MIKMNKNRTSAETKKQDARPPYEKPVVRKVNLAVEETLSSGCKLDGAPCVPPPPLPALEEAGS